MSVHLYVAQTAPAVYHLRVRNRFGCYFMTVYAGLVVCCTASVEIPKWSVQVLVSEETVFAMIKKQDSVYNVSAQSLTNLSEDSN